MLAREDHAKEVKLFGARAAAPRALSRRSSSSCYARGPRADDPPRRLGLRARARRDGGVLRRLCLDRASRPCAARITLGEMTMYLLRVQAGAVGGRAPASPRSAACTRTTSTCRTSTSSSTRRSTAADRHGGARARARRRRALRERVLHLSGRRASRRSATSICTSGPGERSRSSARTAPARPR